MSQIALGTKVFSRAGRLSGLLDSVEDTPVDTVYVADDGEPTAEKSRLYDADYPFELQLLNLEYDAGLGFGRDRIVDVLDEEYLLIVDSDHEVPANVETLVAQLEARPDLGGISGLLYEHGKIEGTCHDLFEHGDALVRDVRTDKSVELVAGAPLVEFDFLPNVALFRRECLHDQSWDPEYVIGKEHLDFYVAHERRTDWTFAVSPTVLFPHHPGGDQSYTADRENIQKHQRSKQYFLEKWGYEQIVLGQTDWIDGSSPRCTPAEGLKALAKSALLAAPADLQIAAMDARDWLREKRSRPPL
jgi:hypothetical protein